MYAYIYIYMRNMCIYIYEEHVYIYIYEEHVYIYIYSMYGMYIRCIIYIYNSCTYNMA